MRNESSREAQAAVKFDCRLRDPPCKDLKCYNVFKKSQNEKGPKIHCQDNRDKLSNIVYFVLSDCLL